MGSIPVGDSDFFFVPCSCHVNQFTFHQFHDGNDYHRYSVITIHDDFDSADPNRMQNAFNTYELSEVLSLHEFSLAMSSRSSLDRELAMCSGGYGCDSLRGLRVFFPCLTLVSC